MSDLFGSDIQLDADLQAVVAADGSLVLCQGLDTGLQDIRLRLITPLGSLFYDKNYGSLLHHWFHEDNTIGNRLAFEAEVLRRVNYDPRVVVGSASCTVTAWDASGLTAAVKFRFIDADHPMNLVITVDNYKMDMVIADVDPV